MVISGGGTGGHVFPALAIARTLQRRHPGGEILFVGAEGRLEMTKVPEAGFPIVGLPVRGFDRKRPWRNAGVLVDLWRSLRKARRIVNDFAPDVVVGVGGYASGPVCRVAGKKGIPVVLQEQNSYAGVTNRLLARYASAICVAYEGMERYFPAEKIVLTGNPVRKEIIEGKVSREEALAHFGIPAGHEVLLVLGGSLGATSVNRALLEKADLWHGRPVFVLWQTGRRDYEWVQKGLEERALPNVKAVAFIERMEMAYAAADVIISRAGAGTISELAVVGKAVILVPSPNVAEDHQTRNAAALVQKEAALLVRDDECREKLAETASRLLENKEERNRLGQRLKEMARPDAADRIVDEIMKTVEKR